MSTQPNSDVLVAFALMPSEDDRFARVAQTVKSCLELIDAREPEHELGAVGSPERWPRVKEALMEARLVVADFSPPTPEGSGPSTETLVAACAARFGRAIPVVVLVRGREQLPFAWQDHEYVIEYEGSREGMSALRRSLGSALQAIAKQVRAGATLIDEGFASVTITAPSAGPAGASEQQEEEEEDPVEKERRIKQMLRERFRKQLAEVPDSSTSTNDSEAEEAQAAQQVSPRAVPAVQQVEGERSVPQIPNIPLGEVGETSAEKLEALHKRLTQRWATERANRPAWLKDTVADYGFDLNFWVEPACEPIVHRGITQAVSEVGGLVDGKPPPEKKEETEEESDDDIVFDPSDIDILKGAKKKKKKKKKKRPSSETAAVNDAGGSETPKSSGERTGVGVLHDRLSGRRLELRQAELTLGRGQEANVTLAAREISKVHTKITKEDGAYFIENHGTNGTFVNNEPVVDRRRLKHGDQITLAKTQDKPEGVRHFVFQQAQK